MSSLSKDPYQDRLIISYADNLPDVVTIKYQVTDFDKAISIRDIPVERNAYIVPGKRYLLVNSRTSLVEDFEILFTPLEEALYGITE